MGFDMNEEDELEDKMRRTTSSTSVRDTDIALRCPVWFGYSWRTPGFVETIANHDMTRKIVSQPKGHHNHSSTSHIQSRSVPNQQSNPLSLHLRRCCWNQSSRTWRGTVALS
eukprot:TRINITY_DN1009_c0_g1_i1.p1 TRINITY_DN1009_c0_g1~~TRINITY_DN1009_c0_g1_i1.p1  ORF type:complete len:112 (-),score=8.05 TRINITY_DN1009_c0_g1_i1:22-357(-)